MNRHVFSTGNSRLYATAILTVLAVMPAGAAPVDLKGKTVTIYVAGGAGGGVDAYARILSPFLSKYLPGQPAMKVANMPGGGGVQAVQYIYNIAPKNGTAIGTTNAGPVAQPLMEKQLKTAYDLRKLNWIGSVAKGNTVCATWHTSPVKTLKDAQTRQAVIGTTGIRSAPTRSALLMNSTLKTQFKPISGYNGGSLLIALESGEIDGVCTTLNSLRTTRPQWLRDKKLNILFHVAVRKDKEYESIPSAYEHMDAKQKKMLEFFLTPYEFNNPYYLPPGVAPEIVKAHRDAFDKAMQDKAYRADAARRKQDIDVETGASVQKMVMQMFATPQDIIDATIAAVNPKGRVTSRAKK